ncbi:hypothetical protein PMN64_21060 [Bradyrhizobium sp. UFLA01-814]|uniref:hypothetical protein n=1 Tax=Bradyrhizobium sp. UFLA01-814 TaxID=3023480 RepID=UPI00398BB639
MKNVKKARQDQAREFITTRRSQHDGRAPPGGEAGRGFLVRSILAHIRLRGARTVVQAIVLTLI